MSNMCRPIPPGPCMWATAAAPGSAMRLPICWRSTAMPRPANTTPTITVLRAKGEVYEGRLPPPKGAPVEDWEDREQTLFRATAFGDDVDRPLEKSDGSYTYFASDIAYHKSKLDRGFQKLIDVWGADHGGYVKRVQAAVAALSDRKAELDVK